MLHKANPGRVGNDFSKVVDLYSFRHHVVKCEKTFKEIKRHSSFPFVLTVIVVTKICSFNKVSQVVADVSNLKVFPCNNSVYFIKLYR